MYVASLELCKELYELSGWEMESTDEYHSPDYMIPAYDLGYLLRKLGPSQHLICSDDGKTWTVDKYTNPGHPVRASADTPEDAACKLSIELFKQGVFPKKGEQQL